MTTSCQTPLTPTIFECNEELFVSSHPLLLLLLAAFPLLWSSGRSCTAALKLLTDFINLMEMFLLTLFIGSYQISVSLPVSAEAYADAELQWPMLPMWVGEWVKISGNPTMDHPVSPPNAALGHTKKNPFSSMKITIQLKMPQYNLYFEPLFDLPCTFDTIQVSWIFRIMRI